MAFAVSKIAWWVLSPGNLLLLLLVAGALLRAFGLRRFGGFAVSLGILLALACAVLPLRGWLMQPLEERFPMAAAPDRVDGIIVIGGAINADLSAKRGQVILTEAAERIFAFVDLARRYPDARLVVSGGASAVFEDQEREADVARRMLPALGLDPERVVFERESRNTVENAAYSMALAKPRAGETWLLVTSAYHMPRSVGIFRHLGWNVTAWPVDYSTAPGEGGPTWAFLDGLTAAHWALREWIGLAYYRLRGDTDALFPAP